MRVGNNPLENQRIHPLEPRPAGAKNGRKRKKDMSPRGERILDRIDDLKVTFDSVARRAGYSGHAIYHALWKGSDAYSLDCVEQALDLEPWSEART